MTATNAGQESSTLATGNSAIRPFQRGSRGLPIAAVGFFTREEEMRHA